MIFISREMTTKQDKECSRNTIHETSIWTKSMLIALDNGVKGGKWFSLIDKVYSLKTLNIAWQQVKSNKGRAGVDKQSIEKFEVNEELYIQDLHQSVKASKSRDITLNQLKGYIFPKLEEREDH